MQDLKMSQTLVTTGRVFYCVSIIGMAIQQLFYPVFRSIFIPEAPAWLPPKAVYIFSVYLILSAILVMTKRGAFPSLILGFVFITLFFVAHVPYRLSQTINNLGVWTLAIKCLAFGGGAFISIATTGSSTQRVFPATIGAKLEMTGYIIFSLMLIAFGTDHFLYTTGVSKMIPAWIPAPTVWTYAGGSALLIAGLAILFNVKRRLSSFLVGAMILSWVFVLHLPGALALPDTGNSHALTSTFHALAFAGIGFMIAGEVRDR